MKSIFTPPRGCQECIRSLDQGTDGWSLSSYGPGAVCHSTEHADLASQMSLVPHGRMIADALSKKTRKPRGRVEVPRDGSPEHRGPRRGIGQPTTISRRTRSRLATASTARGRRCRASCMETTTCSRMCKKRHRETQNFKTTHQPCVISVSFGDLETSGRLASVMVTICGTMPCQFQGLRGVERVPVRLFVEHVLSHDHSCTVDEHRTSSHTAVMWAQACD